MAHDLPIYSGTPPGLEDHPIFSGEPFAMISGEAPRFPSAPGGHDALRQLLTQQGLPYEETSGDYGGPERSFIVHGPSREQAYHLGKAMGQEAVVWGAGGNHEMLYTNGPNDGQAHPGLPQVGFHPTEQPPSYFTKVPSRGYLRLHFGEGLQQAPLRPPEQVANDNAQPATRQDVAAGLAKALRKSVELAKRSKNVREQTRNISPRQATERRVQYAQSLGLKPQKTFVGDGFPQAKQNKLQYGDNFAVEHETAHAMMTPPGSTIRQYQRYLSSHSEPKDDPSNDSWEPDEAHAQTQHEENVANQLENMIDRRAGVSPKHASKFRGIAVKSKNAGDEELSDDVDYDATERMWGTKKPGPENVFTQDVRDEAGKSAERFDAGARFNNRGRVEGQFNLDQRINLAAKQGGLAGHARLREMIRGAAAKKTPQPQLPLKGVL